jgi:hypothetical protein
MRSQDRRLFRWFMTLAFGSMGTRGSTRDTRDIPTVRPSSRVLAVAMATATTFALFVSMLAATAAAAATSSIEPAGGGSAEAQPTTPGGSSPPATITPNALSFAGYSWAVKSSTSPVGPGPNVFDAKGPYVDSSGSMHLRIVKTTSGWESSEVILNPTLGYGTYRWTVHGPLATFDPNVVLALFTYDNSTTSPTNREIDFEASRFADASNATNAQYVVQPWDTPGNLQRITIPQGTETIISLTWTPGSVAYTGETVRYNGKAVALPSWTNTSASVPNSSTEQVHMSLWLFRGAPPSNGKPVAVEVTGFAFSPAN